MSRRQWSGSHRESDQLNRGDYRGDFGGEGYHRFDSPPDDRGRQHHEGRSGRSSRPDPPDRDAHDRHGGAPTAGRWEWRHGREGWQRSRVGGGFGSQYDAWSQGAGMRHAHSRSGPAHAGRGGFVDEDWQPTRPARGRGAWAGDWENEEAARHEARDDHRGRGPKGYRRSDAAIQEEANDRLTDDPAVDATDIIVAVREGEVSLSGTVTSRDQKRRAEQCVERIRGVHDVINGLRVSGTTRTNDSQRATGGSTDEGRSRR